MNPVFFKELCVYINILYVERREFVELTFNYSGWPHPNEYRRNVLADNVTAQVIRDEKRNMFLHINEYPIVQWFMEQLGLSQKETQRKGNRL